MADTVNHSLEQAGQTERVDHRNFANRGIDEQPTMGCHTAGKMRSEKAKFDRMKTQAGKTEDQQHSLTDQLDAQADRFTELQSEVAPEQAEELIECRFSLREKSNTRIAAKLLGAFGGSFDRARLSRASEAVDRRLGKDPKAYQEYADRQHREKEAERQKDKQPER